MTPEVLYKARQDTKIRQALLGDKKKQVLPRPVESVVVIVNPFIGFLTSEVNDLMFARTVQRVSLRTIAAAGRHSLATLERSPHIVRVTMLLNYLLLTF